MKIGKIMDDTLNFIFDDHPILSGHICIGIICIIELIR